LRKKIKKKLQKIWLKEIEVCTFAAPNGKTKRKILRKGVKVRHKDGKELVPGIDT
jgi:hypothetical protein